MGTEFQEGIEGVFFGLPEKVYRKAEGISQSSLKEMARSAAHFDEARRAPHKETEALTFGTVAHHLLLTPGEKPFWDVKPAGMSFTTKEGKAWKAEREQAGTEIISEEAMFRIAGCVKALKAHPIVARVLDEGRFEISLFKKWTLGGSCLRKGRVDASVEGPALFDFKFVEDARAGGYSGNSDMNAVKLLGDLRVKGFSHHVFEYGYHIQAAYYLDLWNENHGQEEAKSKFVFLVVEKEPPFAVSIFELDHDVLARGRQEYIELLTRYVDCVRTGVWPVYHERSSYSPDIRTIQLPSWAKPKQQLI